MGAISNIAALIASVVGLVTALLQYQSWRKTNGASTKSSQDGQIAASPLVSPRSRAGSVPIAVRHEMSTRTAGTAVAIAVDEEFEDLTHKTASWLPRYEVIVGAVIAYFVFFIAYRPANAAADVKTLAAGLISIGVIAPTALLFLTAVAAREWLLTGHSFPVPRPSTVSIVRRWTAAVHRLEAATREFHVHVGPVVSVAFVLWIALFPSGAAAIVRSLSTGLVDLVQGFGDFFSALVA